MQLPALSTHIIEQVITSLKCATSFEPCVSEFKQRFPDFRFILCSEDDMGFKEPYVEESNFDLHLMAQGLGCAVLTHQIEKSAGIVIACREED